MANRTNVPDVSGERVTISFGVGAFEGLGGGAVLKWVFTDGHFETMMFRAVRCVELLRAAERSIEDRRYPDLRTRPAKERGRPQSDPVAVFLDYQPDLAPEDFDAQNGGRIVSAWTWTAATNGVVVDFEFEDTHRSAVGLHGQLCYYLRDYLKDINFPLSN